MSKSKTDLPQRRMPVITFTRPLSRRAINFCKSILPESLDTCEGGRYSCYIGADMIMVPCSFDQKKRYEVSLRDMSIEEAWNSEPFELFRGKMRAGCPSCEKKELCMGGCPLMPEIVFCNSNKRTTIKNLERD